MTFTNDEIKMREAAEKRRKIAEMKYHADKQRYYIATDHINGKLYWIEQVANHGLSTNPDLSMAKSFSREELDNMPNLTNVMLVPVEYAKELVQHIVSYELVDHSKIQKL